MRRDPDLGHHGTLFEWGPRPRTVIRRVLVGLAVVAVLGLLAMVMATPFTGSCDPRSALPWLACK